MERMLCFKDNAIGLALIWIGSIVLFLNIFDQGDQADLILFY
jgi:hypothetical protein